MTCERKVKSILLKAHEFVIIWTKALKKISIKTRNTFTYKCARFHGKATMQSDTVTPCALTVFFLKKKTHQISLWFRMQIECLVSTVSKISYRKVKLKSVETFHVFINLNWILCFEFRTLNFYGNPIKWLSSAACRLMAIKYLF